MILNKPHGALMKSLAFCTLVPVATLIRQGNILFDSSSPATSWSCVPIICRFLIATSEARWTQVSQPWPWTTPSLLLQVLILSLSRTEQVGIQDLRCSNNMHACAHVCECVCTCVRACVYVCACECVYVWLNVFGCWGVHACARLHPQRV